MAETIEPSRPGHLARLGWRVERRPRPGFAHVLGAAAGAFVVVGVTAFVVEATSDDPTTPGVLFNIALIVVAWLLGMRAPGPIRSACVTAMVFAVPLLWFFAFFGGGSVGRGELRGVYLLTLVSYAVFYLLTWTRGRAIFLAGVLLAFASWATFEVSDSNSSVVPFRSGFSVSGTRSPSSASSSSGSTSFGTTTTNSSSSLFGVGDNTDAASTTALVIGLVFLGVGAMLDRRRFAGAATPFVAVGAIETLVGAIVLGGNESVLLAGLLAIAAGAVVGLVGSRGDQRRATTWIGVIAVFGGCVAVITDIRPDSAAGVGGIAFGFALVLGSIAWWLAPVLGEPDDGDDRVPPPTAPPGGSSEGSTEGTTETLPDAAVA
jgi:hypothetical protein